MKSRLAALAVTMTIAVATAVLLAAVACGGSEDAAVDLDGTSWRLSGWSLSSLDPADFTITAEFADGKISGKSAVNNYMGSYTQGPGDAFSVGDVAGTMMAGPEPEMRAESAYLKLLAEAKSYALKDGGLTLFDEGGNESLIFASE